MIKLMINGESKQITAAKLADLLQEVGAKPPYAVAINGEFVPQTEYAGYQVQEHDQIDIVSPVFGG